MTNNFKVYCYTSPSNKKYIGITSYSQNKRAGKNGAGYKNCISFYRAIEKYGFENFQYEILEENLSQKEAFEKEKFYISFFNTVNPDKGYNISLGGEAPFLGRHHSEETKQKLHDSLSGEKCYWYGKHLSEEIKNKISQSKKGKCSGENNPNYGKHMTEESKEKMRKTFKERNVSVGKNNPNYGKTGDKNPLSKKIYCILDGEKIYFTGVKEAGRIMNIKSPNISRSLTSNGKFSAGKSPNGNKIYWFY